jgi:hypothetical protein
MAIPSLWSSVYSPTSISLTISDRSPFATLTPLALTLRAKSAKLTIPSRMVTQILAGCDDSGLPRTADRKPFAGPPEVPDNGPDLTSEMIGRALSALQVLDRYESRAAARRDKTVRHIISSRNLSYLHL